MLPLSLADRTALVTGGSRGIGAAIVRMFVQAGAHVVFNYQHAQQEAAAVVRACGEDRCLAVAADLSTPGSAGSLVERAVGAWGVSTSWWRTTASGPPRTCPSMR